MAEENKVAYNIGTNGEYTSYDNQFTAMGFNHYGRNSFVTLAAIHPDKKGKDIHKKGDEVYNYDTQKYVKISHPLAQDIIKGIDYLLSLPEDTTVKHIQFDMSVFNEDRKLIIYTPGNFVIKGGVKFPNFVLKYTIVDSDDKVSRWYHLLNKSEFTIMEDEESTITVEHDLLMLQDFCKEVVKLAFNSTWHSVRRNNTGSSTGKKRSSSQDDVEEENDTSSSKTRAKATKSSLEEEFGE
jgi:hypothetical protein